MSDMADILKVFEPWGPGWLLGILLLVGAGYFANKFLEEYRAQNKRRSELDLKREERKQSESAERAKRDRERSEMEGRIATQMERSNALMEAMKTLMESVTASNQVLHEDIISSQARSQNMAASVDHIKDRVDMIFEETRQ